MNIRIKTNHSNEEIDTDAERVEDILKEKEINPVSHIAIINGEPAAESQEIKENDEIRIYKVTSSG